MTGKKIQKIIRCAVQSFVVLFVCLSTSIPQYVFADMFGVTTEYPSGMSDSIKVFNGYVANSGNESVSAWFEYGTNGSFQASSYKIGVSRSGSISAIITNLDPNTEYVYRAVARQDKSGQTVYGETKKFTNTSQTTGVQESSTTNTSGSSVINTNTGNSSSGAKPVVSEGLEPVIADENQAELNASIVAGTFPVTVWFEWGTTQSLGNETQHRDIQSGSALVVMKEKIYGLKPGTTYYYRAVALTSAGKGESSVMEFSTRGNGSIVNNTTADTASSKSGVVFEDVSNDGSIISETDISGSQDTNQISQMAGALGWGSILKDQFFTIDEDGNIVSAGTFGTDAQASESSFLGTFLSFDGILPNSFFGWLAWVIIAYILLSQIQYWYARKEKRRLEKEEQEKALQEAKKYEDFVIKNKKIA